jgi:hypothetical protein
MGVFEEVGCAYTQKRDRKLDIFEELKGTPSVDHGAQRWE